MCCLVSHLNFDYLTRNNSFIKFAALFRTTNKLYKNGKPNKDQRNSKGNGNRY